MKTATMCVIFLAGAALLLADAPKWGKVRSPYSSVTAVYVAGSGTNDYVDVPYDGDAPFRIADVSATVGGVSTNVTLYRLWQYSLPRRTIQVATDFWSGNVTTNYHLAGYEVTIVTNTLYVTGVTALPTPAYVLGGETLRAAFDDTNTIVRIIGTSQ
jgi:hypothetical protein